MPITGQTKPIQLPEQQVEPFQPLPVQQIQAAGERLTDRLTKTQDELADLQMGIAEQQVLPQNQEKFALATEGVRDRIGRIAESDEIYNRLPQVRREARKFAEVAKGFQQNKENVEESLKALREAENMPETHRRALERRIRENAGVSLTDEGTVDPSSISRQMDFGDAQNPMEYLDEPLGSMEESVRHDIKRQNGVIIDSELRRLTKSRLMAQGLAELGLSVKDPNKELTADNIKGFPGGNASAEVQTWMQRESLRMLDSKAREKAENEIDPDENPQAFRQRVQELRRNPTKEIEDEVDQHLKDRAVGMVRTVAGRHVQPANTDINIKGDPAASGRGGTSNQYTSTTTPGMSVVDEETRALSADARERYISTQTSENENITRDQYKRMKEATREGKRPSATHAYLTGGSSGPAAKFDATNREDLVDRYGEDTVAAFENIREGEDVAANIAGEQNEVQLADGAEDEIVKFTSSNYESPNATDEQLSWLLSNKNNFTALSKAQNNQWLRLEVRRTTDAPGGGAYAFGTIGGRSDLSAGDEVVIKPEKLGMSGGTKERNEFDALNDFVGDASARVMEEESMVADRDFTEWNSINSREEDIQIRRDQVFLDGQFSAGRGVVTPRYNTRVNGDDVRIGDVVKGAASTDVPEEKRVEIFSDLAQSINEMPEASAIKQATEGNMSPGQIPGMMRDYAQNRDELSEEEIEAMETLLDLPVPSTRPGRAGQWGRVYKQLN